MPDHDDGRPLAGQGLLAVRNSETLETSHAAAKRFVYGVNPAQAATRNLLCQNRLKERLQRAFLGKCLREQSETNAIPI